MSAFPFTSHHAFDPETTEVLGSAFEKICADLGLSLRGDRLTEVVARQIIEAAQSGMRNETAIRLAVLEKLKSNAH
jgi:hypothetical protein